MAVKALKTTCVVGSPSQHLSFAPMFRSTSETSITLNPPLFKKKPWRSQICRYVVPSATMKLRILLRSVTVRSNPPDVVYCLTLWIKAGTLPEAIASRMCPNAPVLAPIHSSSIPLQTCVGWVPQFKPSIRFSEKTTVLIPASRSVVRCQISLLMTVVHVAPLTWAVLQTRSATAGTLAIRHAILSPPEYNSAQNSW